eukprot:403350271
MIQQFLNDLQLKKQSELTQFFFQNNNEKEVYSILKAINTMIEHKHLYNYKAQKESLKLKKQNSEQIDNFSSNFQNLKELIQSDLISDQYCSVIETFDLIKKRSSGEVHIVQTQSGISTLALCVNSNELKLYDYAKNQKLFSAKSLEQFTFNKAFYCPESDLVYCLSSEEQLVVLSFTEKRKLNEEQKINYPLYRTLQIESYLDCEDLKVLDIALVQSNIIVVIFENTRIHFFKAVTKAKDQKENNLMAFQYNQKEKSFTNIYSSDEFANGEILNLQTSYDYDMQLWNTRFTGG